MFSPSEEQSVSEKNGRMVRFTECPLTIFILAIERVARVLFDEALRSFFELIQRRFGPPGAYVAIGVVLAALIVEAMYDFMADYLSGTRQNSD